MQAFVYVLECFLGLNSKKWYFEFKRCIGDLYTFGIDSIQLLVEVTVCAHVPHNGVY